MTVKALAPAKINITLDVLSKRADGYHNISSVMQAVSLYDEITVERAEGNEISVTCNVPEIPCNGDNLVCKAAVQFFNYIKAEKTGLNIHIEKQIPSQAGLAGGSTDAAATVLALNRLFDTFLTPREMLDICAHLGADVPFCLYGGTRLATGIGEKLEKIRDFPKCHVVICKPSDNVSTRLAYERVDALSPKNAVVTELAVRSLYAGDLGTICSTLYNDFEVALGLESVKEIKKIMYKCKARGCSMTGSGSAVFALFTDEKRALKCVDALKKSYENVYLCQTVKDGCKIK